MNQPSIDSFSVKFFITTGLYQRDTFDINDTTYFEY